MFILLGKWEILTGNDAFRREKENVRVERVPPRESRAVMLRDNRDRAMPTRNPRDPRDR